MSKKPIPAVYTIKADSASFGTILLSEVRFISEVTCGDASSSVPCIFTITLQGPNGPWERELKTYTHTSQFRNAYSKLVKDWRTFMAENAKQPQTEVPA